MLNKLTTPQQLHSQLQELENDVEKLKVRLTEEVRQYIRTNLETVQNKLINGKPVYDEDMEFMREVRMWVGMPEEWREKYQSIEAVKKSGAIEEAKKRKISLNQWLCLLHMADVSGKTEEWIDEAFDLSEDGKIKANGRLDLKDCTSLKSLPENLIVNEKLGLEGCTSLTSIPEDLAAEHLHLDGCTGLAENKASILPLLWEKLLKEEIGGLNLTGWPLEDNDLPKRLSVKQSLSLSNCKNLTKLPEELEVGKFLFLSGCINLVLMPKRLKVKNLMLGECLNLAQLPDGLEVHDLSLGGCTSLTSLPNDLSVDWSLYLYECINLTSLPDRLEVKYLNIEGCTNLTTLPKGLRVKTKLRLSESLNEQVKKDAEQLEAEGKIGKISYEGDYKQDDC